MALAIALCAMNSFLTLSFGIIEEGPNIAALFFFAGFVLSKTRITSGEMVIVSTMGSAGGSLGFITNFFAAKVMTGAAYTLGQMAAFCVVTSLLGMLAVIPLRELLVVRETLPWPSSRAVATVISTLVEKPDRRHVSRGRYPALHRLHRGQRRRRLWARPRFCLAATLWPGLPRRGPGSVPVCPRRQLLAAAT